MCKVRAKICSLSLVLITFFSYSKAVLSDPVLVGYWGYNEYLEKHPEERKVINSLKSMVKETPVPLALTQE